VETSLILCLIKQAIFEFVILQRSGLFYAALREVVFVSKHGFLQKKPGF
jgi:hypothetical protein